MQMTGASAALLLAAAAPALATEGADESIAAVTVPDEPGWTLVQVPGGYFRLREAEPGSGRGSVVIVPATPNVAEGEPQALPERTTGRPLEPCHEERASLAQRVAYLKGMELDPESALVALQDERAVWWPAGAPPSVWPAGSSSLDFAGWDTPARDLLRALARCLATAPRYP